MVQPRCCGRSNWAPQGRMALTVSLPIARGISSSRDTPTVRWQGNTRGDSLTLGWPSLAPRARCCGRSNWAPQGRMALTVSLPIARGMSSSRETPLGHWEGATREAMTLGWPSIAPMENSGGDGKRELVHLTSLTVSLPIAMGMSSSRETPLATWAIRPATVAFG
jgi:hypothetical protein